jgi:quinolinate synthase
MSTIVIWAQKNSSRYRRMKQTIADRIALLKKQSNALILAHNYQLPEIQDIADFVGDSLDLAMRATQTSSDIIVFCGVDFMAESAKILNPEKTVIIPDSQAQCPMAAMIDVESLTALKQDHPRAPVVSYINTSAAVKALSDICCTSSNGAKVVRSLDAKELIFTPDANLGTYIQRLVPEKSIVIFPGVCPTHHKITPEQILALKHQHPQAEILVHPECRIEVIDIADHALSTNGMVNHVKNSPCNEFIIGTERDLCYRLQKENPTKQFYPLETAVCPNMKKITLEKVLNSLKTLEPQITLSPDIIKRAKVPLQRMMNVGRGD